MLRKKRRVEEKRPAEPIPPAGNCRYSGHMADTSEQQTVWTVGRLLDWTTKWFQQRQVEGGRLAAELLLARAMNCRKIDLYTRYDVEPH